MLKEPSLTRTLARRRRGPTHPKSRPDGQNYDNARSRFSTPRRSAFHVAATVAEEFSRRSFLRSVGMGGLAVGLGIAGSPLFASLAGSAGSCSAGACGPSPLCPSAQCSGGQCYRLGGSANRNYNSLYCGTSNNCWTESYPSGCRTPGSWLCCDCCAISGAGSICTNGPSCTGTFRACICRSRR